MVGKIVIIADSKLAPDQLPAGRAEAQRRLEPTAGPVPSELRNKDGWPSHPALRDGSRYEAAMSRISRKCGIFTLGGLLIMNITRIAWLGVYLSASLWMVGCSTSNPEDAMKDWKCLYSNHQGYHPGDEIPANSALAYANFCQQHKAVLDNAQAYINKVQVSDTPPAPDTNTFLDIFADVDGMKVYEDGSGRHAVMYYVHVKGRWTDEDNIYLLFYDKSDVRTKVMRKKYPAPSNGFGQIKSGLFTGLG
jgi:hypothetical protein